MQGTLSLRASFYAIATISQTAAWVGAAVVSKVRACHPRLLTALLSLAILLSLLCPFAVHAQFCYETNNNSITITCYSGPGGDVVIPDTIDGLPVTSIGKAAFSDTNLTSVTIPDSVTTIGDYAFCVCRRMTNATIGNNVTSIGEGAFWDCIRLTSLTIPKSVTTIGEWAFYDCRSLISATLPDSITEIEDSVFCGCRSLTSITIPNSVISIGSNAFCACNSLTNVTIPDSVISIGDSAFSGCTSLTSVTIPNSVTSIGGSGFYGCYSLTNATIGYGVTRIGGSAFSWCSNLTTMHFWGNTPQDDGSIFVGPNNITNYYLPGTTNWGSTYSGRPTAMWRLQYPVILVIPPSFGVKPNNYGFRISWATNASVVVEACTNLGIWSPIATNTISMGINPLMDGWTYFTDPDWTNSPARFYRLRSP